MMIFVAASNFGDNKAYATGVTETLFAVDDVVDMGSNNTARLMAIDNGGDDVVESIGNYQPWGLAYGPDGMLYTSDPVQEIGEPEISKLLRIDPSTGAIAVIGSVPGDLSGLAFDQSGTLFGADSASDNLIMIDPATAATAIVGPLGKSFVDALTFDSSGNLFGYDEQDEVLLSIDTASGLATSLGRPRFSNGAFANLNAIAFDSEDTLFGIYGRNLLIVDLPSNTATTAVYLGSSRIRGIAFESEISAIPEPTAALFLCGSCALAWLRRRR